jgi:hypothetical protein
MRNIACINELAVIKIVMKNMLLKDVALIREKYEAISRLTGNSFNIFKLIGVLNKEVSFHSKFISELLNPKGSHSLGDTFLLLFLDGFGVLEQFDSRNVKVLTESYVGRLSDDYLDGGLIDILLHDGKSALVIENKIFAGDQKYQLVRYHNYARRNFKYFKVLYLTLNGDLPDKISIGESNIEFDNISYENEILEWLEKCREKAVSHPTLRETISQYIGAIKILTNQTENKLMSEEIIKAILKDHESIKSYFDLRRKDVESGVKKDLLERFKDQMRALANKLKLRPEFDDQFGMKKEPTYLKFHFEDSKKGFYISLCFCSWDKYFVLQLDCNDNERDNCRQEVLSMLPDRDKDFNEIWIKWFEGNLKHWTENSEPWLMIINGELKSIIESKFQVIIDSLIEFEK